MKFWIEAIQEPNDAILKCDGCGNLLYPNKENTVFVEFDLRSGGLPNPNELHPEPTNKFMCQNCGRKNLI